MANSFANTLAKLKTQMAADKKKATVLVVLFVVLLVAVVHVVFSGPESEPTEVASLAVAAQGSGAKPPRPLARPRSDAPSASVPRLKRPRKSTTAGARGHSGKDAKLQKPASIKDMPRTLARDIFSTTAWDRFALDRPDVEADPEVENTAGSPGLFARWGRRLIEQRGTREREMAQLRAELAELELQSTLTGTSRSAYISGRLVHEGDVVRGFLVIRIKDRAVLLRKSGVLQSLNMP